MKAMIRAIAFATAITMFGGAVAAFAQGTTTVAKKTATKKKASKKKKHSKKKTSAKKATKKAEAKKS